MSSLSEPFNTSLPVNICTTFTRESARINVHYRNAQFITSVDIMFVLRAFHGVVEFRREESALDFYPFTAIKCHVLIHFDRLAEMMRNVALKL